eukprot:15355883-Ditylum_brightwellii.AAC.2
MLDMILHVKDRLLCIECSYPSDDDLNNLPWVWLIVNKVPWDPSILEDKNGITIPSCWVGGLEFMEATNKDAQEEGDSNKFEEYVIQQNKALTFFAKAMCLAMGGSIV